jgi:hypothetical protein
MFSPQFEGVTGNRPNFLIRSSGAPDKSRRSKVVTRVTSVLRIRTRGQHKLPPGIQFRVITVTVPVFGELRV